MSAIQVRHPGRVFDLIAVALLFFISGLAITRLLYEALFPGFLWLGRPLPAFLLAGTLAGLAWLLWFGLSKKQPQKRAGSLFAASAAFSPLLMNLLYLLDPTVNLVESRMLFAASLWLGAVLLARQLAPAYSWSWLGILFVFLAVFPLYLLTMPNVAGRADTFEFQVVIPRLGIAHPTGYPLYMLLGRLFAALPFGTAAWRINLASAVFATLAAAVIYLAGRRLWHEPLAALLAAVLLGLTPTLWSQAIQAEVYALHALFVAGALWLMAVMLEHGSETDACAKPVFSRPVSFGWRSTVWMLAFLFGLGLSNHLTMIMLIPAGALTVWLAFGRCLRSQGWRANVSLFLQAAIAFSLPLLLYAYLPLRWAALHNEPMGMARFVDWVIGGRFQGALRLTAWLSDAARYQIVGRLLLSEWGWYNLLIALLGVIFAANHSWRATLVLLVAWAGTVFYALNYFVPDLAVFLIPASAVIALFWAAGLAGLLSAATHLLERQGWSSWRLAAGALLTLLAVVPALHHAVEGRPDTDFREQIALQAWGEGVLALPLARDAAILADSEKIAPLYYLQQAEGLRPDLEIMVLPDETAYRAEVDARVVAGETVYLARYLPGLEGAYHLRSQGPLIEVSAAPLRSLPAGATAAGLQFGNLRLLGYEIEEPAATDAGSTAVTLYWQADQPASSPQFFYVRWSWEGHTGAADRPEGAHPAGNSYPTVAWRPGEIVADYHLLPRPVTGVPRRLDLQVAAGPQFAEPDSLDWQTVTAVEVRPAESMEDGHDFRAQNGRMLLSQAAFPVIIRPGTPLPVLLGGYATPLKGGGVPAIELELLPVDEEVGPPRSAPLDDPRPASDQLVYATEVDTDLPNGRYRLISSDPQAAAICGWLAAPSAGCVLGEVEISGLPLPADAANFDDKLALLAIDLPDKVLQPGGTLPVRLRWQGLAGMQEDYTVFLQVLNDRDQIVGQVDAWPVQGTYPTSRWQPGETIEDTYEIRLAGDLPPGDYRLQVGLYLLATLRRLPVLDAQGRPIDDKVVISNLTVK